MYRVSLHKNHGCQKFWSLELSNHQYIKAVPPFKTKHATSSKISCGKPLEPKHPPQASIERNNHPYPVTKLLYPYPRGRSPHHFPSTRTEGVQSTNDARGTAPHLSKASKRRRIPLPCHTAPSSKRGTCYLDSCSVPNRSHHHVRYLPEGEDHLKKCLDTSFTLQGRFEHDPGMIRNFTFMIA